MRYCAFLLLIVTCIGCKQKADDPAPITKFGNVVILGNSITFADQDASIGWNANWGMAASAPEKDYVHLLTAKLRQYNDTCKVQVDNIGAFETGYSYYDLDANLKSYRDSKPDLLIIRIGDNVPAATFDPTAFSAKYQALINYMKTGNPTIKILAVGPFYGGRDFVNNIMNQYTPFLSLVDIGSSNKNYAYYLVGVADVVKQHPGDQGMIAIANAIWAQVRVM